jgi:hypothetical protein
MKADSQSQSGDSLLAVLGELLSAQSLTADQLRTWLATHPELLSEEAQVLLRAIANIQESPEARQHVERVGALLARLEKEDADSVLVEEGSQLRRRRAKEKRTARLHAKRESFLAWREERKVGAPHVDAGQPLPSLSEVVAHLRAISVNELPQPFGFDVLIRQSTSKSLPAFLFRGESAAFPQTCTSLARLRTGGTLSLNALADIDRISESLVQGFGEKWGLGRTQALGFLQHYGYPTEFIDVTLDVSVAASFASWMRVGDEGAMCVVPTKYRFPEDDLIDLRYHPMAKRPRRQSAFALHLREFPDLKSPDAIEALSLTWIPFRFTETDAVRFAPDFELLDARSDEVAGLIWLMIGDGAKFDDAAAGLLSQRIDPAPVFGVPLQDGTMALTSEDDAMFEEGGSDEAFRRTHYERWSKAFAEIKQEPLPPELEAALVKGPLPRGSVLQIMTSRAIGTGRRKD